jgi:hypothetical protein
VLGQPWLIMSAPCLCRQIRHCVPLPQRPGQSFTKVSLHCFVSGGAPAAARAETAAGRLSSPAMTSSPPSSSSFFFLQVPPGPHVGKSCGQQCEWSAQHEALTAAQHAQNPADGYEKAC